MRSCTASKTCLTWRLPPTRPVFPAINRVDDSRSNTGYHQLSYKSIGKPLNLPKAIACFSRFSQRLRHERIDPARVGFDKFDQQDVKAFLKIERLSSNLVFCNCPNQNNLYST
jgi:hypothetical protein